MHDVLDPADAGSLPAGGLERNRARERPPRATVCGRLADDVRPLHTEQPGAGSRTVAHVDSAEHPARRVAGDEWERLEEERAAVEHHPAFQPLHAEPGGPQGDRGPAEQGGQPVPEGGEPREVGVRRMEAGRDGAGHGAFRSGRVVLVGEDNLAPGR